MGKLYSPRPTFAKMLQNCVLLQQSGPCATIKPVWQSRPPPSPSTCATMAIALPRRAWQSCVCCSRPMSRLSGPTSPSGPPPRRPQLAPSPQPLRHAAIALVSTGRYRCSSALALPPCICVAGRRILAWQSPSSHTTTILPVRCVARARMWPHQNSRPPCKPPPGATAIAWASIASRLVVSARAASIVPAPIRIHTGTHTARRQHQPALPCLLPSGQPALFVHARANGRHNKHQANTPGDPFWWLHLVELNVHHGA